MVEVTVHSHEVTLELTGWDIILALKKRLVFPLSSVVQIYAKPHVTRPTGFRMPGTSIPGVIQAGTYVWRGEREFWLTRSTGNTVVFELANLPYTRAVVDVREPELVVQRVRAAWAA